MQKKRWDIEVLLAGTDRGAMGPRTCMGPGGDVQDVEKREAPGDEEWKRIEVRGGVSVETLTVIRSR